jgi:TonB dependent receptor-like, beta-barrel
MAWTPSVDTVEEFRVLTSSFSAEFGRTGGGIVSIATKSGTNKFHGDAFEFLRNTVLDANTFFDNRNGVSRQPLIFNMFGGSIGGPIRRDRTFFFFSYEGQRAHQGNSLLSTVPTHLQKQGDFSQTFNSAGQPITIYNPFSTQSTSTGYIRDAFQGNVIPPGMIDPVAQHVLSFYPDPNLPGQGPSGINNFISSAPLVNGFDTYDARIDQNFSERNRLFVRASWDKQTAVPANFFHNLATSDSFGPSVQPDYNATIGDTHTFGPNTLLEVRLGFARNGFDRRSESDGLDMSTLGFPSSFNTAVQTPQFPLFSISGMAQVGSFNVARYLLASNLFDGSVQVARTQGRHMLRFGFEYRNYLMNSFYGLSPTFGFNAAFTQGPNPLVSSAGAGYGFASFLLGTPSGGSTGINSDETFSWPNYAGFIQDDVRVSSKLTLNLGLRYSFQAPRTDRFNELTWFDPNVANPIGPQVGLPNLKGGLEFAGVNGNSRGLGQPVYDNFAPRFGFAYHILPKMVIRGGYGLVYLPNGTGTGAPDHQAGFSVSTSMLTTQNGVFPADLLRNPFPQGLNQPTGSSLGLLTLLGQNILGWLPNPPIGYVEEYNLNIQRDLPGNVLLQMGYVGSHGVDIPASFSYDQLPDQYLSMGQSLLTLVPNPFYGNVSQGVYSRPTIQQGYLLRPFPQFTGVSSIANNNSAWPGGYSDYNSFQLSIEKRFSKGFSILGAYTNSKLITDAGDVGFNFLGDNRAVVQDYNNRQAERSLSPEDISQRLIINYVYDLPLGPGKRWLSGTHGVMERLAEGWRAVGITTFQTGFPLALTTATNNTNSYGGGSRPNNNGQSAKLTGSARTLDEWFNTSVFSLPPPFTFGNVGPVLPDVRSDGISNFDFSVIKVTSLMSERYNLEFHADIFNLFNHPQFGMPGTSLGTSQFGVVSSQANSPRLIQLGLKLTF